MSRDLEAELRSVGAWLIGGAPAVTVAEVIGLDSDESVVDQGRERPRARMLAAAAPPAPSTTGLVETAPSSERPTLIADLVMEPPAVEAVPEGLQVIWVAPSTPDGAPIVSYDLRVHGQTMRVPGSSTAAVVPDDLAPSEVSGVPGPGAAPATESTIGSPGGEVPVAVRACTLEGCGPWVSNQLVVEVSAGSVTETPGCRAPTCRALRVDVFGAEPGETLTVDVHSDRAGSEEWGSSQLRIDGSGAGSVGAFTWGFPGVSVWAETDGMTSNTLVWPDA